MVTRLPTRSSVVIISKKILDEERVATRFSAKLAMTWVVRWVGKNSEREERTNGTGGLSVAAGF